MDTALKRKAAIRTYLESKIGFPNRYFPLLQDHIIVDETESHFIHLLMGWKKKAYIYTALRHIEIKTDGQIIIHKNNIDKPLEIELMQLGVLESEIVLAMDGQLEAV